MRSSIKPARPLAGARFVVTEDYAPNFKLACERLSPLGVEVVRVAVSETGTMPFADGEFNLVLNRHADFNSSEVARVLSPRGTFLTEQVHGMSLWDLQAALDAAPEFPDATPEKYVPMLKEAGLTIVSLEEWEGRIVFGDVGAIVYYLKAISVGGAGVHGQDASSVPACATRAC